MITVKVTDGVGNIGLVAVAASHRGRGVGSKLIEAAHRWMHEHDAIKSTVVTQGANAPACLLMSGQAFPWNTPKTYTIFGHKDCGSFARLPWAFSALFCAVPRMKLAPDAKSQRTLRNLQYEAMHTLRAAVYLPDVLSSDTRRMYWATTVFGS